MCVDPLLLVLYEGRVNTGSRSEVQVLYHHNRRPPGARGVLGAWLHHRHLDEGAAAAGATNTQAALSHII